MPNYRADQLWRILDTLDKRTQTDDDAIGQDENTIQDVFQPISEKLTLGDVVTTTAYDPSTFAWGGAKTLLTPSFARSGTAIVPTTGASVQANEPRYVSGKYGLGVMVEEGTTNLALYSDFTNLSQLPVNGGVTLTSGIGAGLVGGVYFVDNTGSGGGRWAYVTPTLSVNTTYTLSVFVKMDDGSIPSPNALNNQGDFSLVIAGTASGVINYVVTSIGSGVYRVSGQFTTGATVSNNNCGVVKYNTQSTKGFKVSGYQIEGKPYATSYHATSGAAASRSAETLTLPTTGLSPTQGTIAAWVYVNSVARRQGATNVICEVLGSVAGQTAILLFHSSVAAEWHLQARSSSNTVIAECVVPDSVTPDGWHRFVPRWNGTSLSLVIDGVPRDTKTMSGSLTAFGATTSVGYRGVSSSGYLNTYFDNVVLDSVAWTDAAVAADYASGAPYAPTATTLAVCDFDGSLDPATFTYDAGWDWNGGAKWNAS